VLRRCPRVGQFGNVSHFELDNEQAFCFLSGALLTMPLIAVAAVVFRQFLLFLLHSCHVTDDTKLVRCLMLVLTFGIVAGLGKLGPPTATSLRKPGQQCQLNQTG